VLKSVLLHVDGDDRRTVGIPAVVQLAARHAARVRGLMILDTRRIIAAAAGCLSAVHAADEGERLQQQEQHQASVLSELTRECLRSGVDFDVRRLRGDPLELLPQEARFHDLIVASWPTAIEPDRDLGAIRTFTELGLRGAQPLLVLRAADRDLQRLLLIYDGSAPSERAIKSFLSLNLYPEADVRLLALGRTDDEARRHLAEMAEYVRPLRSEVELGRTSGALRKVVANYIQKWGADLVVLGIPRRDGLLSRLWGDAVADALRDTSAAVYMSG
jgi:nucleotide-binding universal stress UspA family protein